MDKAPDAFRTISEVADELDIPQHVLRFWETRFSQIKPMKRSGGRRFYRPDDVDLLRGIRRLLYGEGYTIRGVQRILKEQGIKSVQALSDGAKAVPSLYALDDGVKMRTPSADDDALENVVVEEPTASNAPEIEAARPPPPPRRPMATPLAVSPLPRMDAEPRFGVAPPFEPVIRVEPPATTVTRPPEPTAASVSSPLADPRPDRRPLDIARLKTVMADLMACRQMLDRALHDG